MLADDEQAWQSGGERRRFATRVEGELVGGCEARVRGAGLATLSYWTFPAHRGRGYATRATRLLAAWAFAELGAERIEVHTEDDNVASLAVARSAGFADTGRVDSDGLRIFELRAT